MITWNAHKGSNVILNVDDINFGNPDVSSFNGLIKNPDEVWVHSFVDSIGYSNFLHAEQMHDIS